MMTVAFYTDNLWGRTSCVGISPQTQQDEWTETMNLIFSVWFVNQLNQTKPDVNPVTSTPS